MRSGIAFDFAASSVVLTLSSLSVEQHTNSAAIARTVETSNVFFIISMFFLVVPYSYSLSGDAPFIIQCGLLLIIIVNL